MGVKIIDLAEASSIQNTDLFAIVQSGSTKKIPFEKIRKAEGVATCSYEMSSTTGWKRIARLPYGFNYGEIIVENDSSYGTLGKLEVADLLGYADTIKKIYKISTNGNFFTKARIVRKGVSESYVELYQALTYERAFRAKVLPGSENIVLYESETSGGIPDGYTADEIDF